MKNQFARLTVLLAVIMTMGAVSSVSKADDTPEIEPLTADASDTMQVPELPPTNNNESASDVHKVQALSKKGDELEMEKEVEGMEEYGEGAEAQVAKKETASLVKENSKLEHDVITLQKRHARADDKVKQLHERYKDAAIQAVAVRKKADQAERELTKTTTNLTNLQAKVGTKKEQIAAAKARETVAAKKLIALKNQNRQLQMRLAKAEQVLKNNKRRQLEMRARQQRIALANRKLAQKVARAERQGRKSVVR